jgi:hypothetical protein
MHIANRFLLIIFSSLLAVNAVQAESENSVTVDDYIIHYNAFNSSQLQPDIAKTYGVSRSKNRAVLNVVVKKGDAVETANITTSAVNLNGQARELDVREVHEGDAVYYISDFRFTDKETLRFTIKVTPNGSGKTYTIQYTKRFFTG